MKLECILIAVSSHIVFSSQPGLDALVLPIMGHNGVPFSG